jgi:hypothetical protein
MPIKLSLSTIITLIKLMFCSFSNLYIFMNLHVLVHFIIYIYNNCIIIYNNYINIDSLSLLVKWKWTLNKFFVILPTQEAEIGRIVNRRQPWANSSQDPISKYPTQKGLVERPKWQSACLANMRPRIQTPVPQKNFLCPCRYNIKCTIIWISLILRAVLTVSVVTVKSFQISCVLIQRTITRVRCTCKCS